MSTAGKATSTSRWKGKVKKGKRAKVHMSPKKKVKNDIAYMKVLQYLKERYLRPELDGKIPSRLYAEDASASTGLRINEVLKAFMRLNREGVMSKRILWEKYAMHTRNDCYGDDPVQWEAKYFNIYIPELYEATKCLQ